MSASREKIVRREQRNQGVEKKQVQAARTVEEKKRYSRVTSIIAAAIAVILIVVIVINSNLFYRHVPAVKVGDDSYNATDFNYYYFSTYYSTYESLYNSYGDYVSYFLDPSKPLASQDYSEDMTWAEYFELSALDSLQQVTVLCNEAEKSGFILPAEQQELIDASISQLNNTYASMGYSSLNNYLEAYYGQGMTRDIYVKNITREYLANAYSNSLTDAMTYSDEQKAAKYDENKDLYDTITYRSITIDGSETDTLDAASALSQAKATAELLAGASSEDVFLDMIDNYIDEGTLTTDSTLYENVTASSLSSSTFYDWIISADRVSGDTDVVEGTNSYSVIFFVDRSSNDYNVKQVRHILLKVATDEETGEVNEADKAAVLEEAEGILDEWKNGEATEESFAELANEHSDDGGSNTTGGLYDTIYLGLTVPEFEGWCFDPERETGDTGIIFVESSNYCGYHIMYYVGEGDVYSNLLATSALKNEEYNSWYDSILPDYPISTKFAMRFTK